MNFTKQVIVNAPADKVWEILGADFNNISEWSSLVLTSDGIPDLPEGSGRVCKVDGIGNVVEEIFHYDDGQRELSFTLDGGTPFFIQRVENSWHVEPDGNNRSVVEMEINVQMLPIFKQLMTRPLTKLFTKRAGIILNELKYFAENGQARPKTQKAAA